MFHNQIFLMFMTIILVSGILIIQHPSETHVAFASESSIYSSGFNKGCDDAGISDPGKKAINQPERNESFTSDEFTRGYVAGFDICSENRQPEFLGVKIAPDIGDIAAIAALIASALIFWFGYRRTRYSEQIKIARELMDRIDIKNQKLDEYLEKNPLQVIEQPDGSLKKVDMSYEQVEDFSRHFREVLSEIEYYVYLSEKEELENKNVKRYYGPKVIVAWDNAINILKERRPHMQKYQDQYDKLQQDLTMLSITTEPLPIFKNLFSLRSRIRNAIKKIV
jgi:hypothetical protein